MSALKSARLWVAILSCGTLAGCQSNAGTGALLGGATGAGLGAIIGHNSHDRAGSGALIGGAIGAATGAIIGNDADKQQARERDDYRYRDYDDRPTVVRERVVERPVYREYVYDAPPPPPAGYVEVVPARPRSRAVWVPGHWVRSRHDWVWVRGYRG